MERPAKHSFRFAAFNIDVCRKCGMTAIEQVEHPKRQCKPPISKRRLKKMFKDAEAHVQRIPGYELLTVGPNYEAYKRHRHAS